MGTIAGCSIGGGLVERLSGRDTRRSHESVTSLNRSADSIEARWPAPSNTTSSAPGIAAASSSDAASGTSTSSSPTVTSVGTATSAARAVRSWVRFASI